MESILHALIDGGHNPRIGELALQSIIITSDELEVLCRTTLVPALFRCLETLVLRSNLQLLDNVAITQRFIQQVLVVPGTTLKKFDVDSCSKKSASYFLSG